MSRDFGVEYAELGVQAFMFGLTRALETDGAMRAARQRLGDELFLRAGFAALKRELGACLEDVAKAGLGTPAGSAIMAVAIDRALGALAGAQLVPEAAQPESKPDTDPT